MSGCPAQAYDCCGKPVASPPWYSPRHIALYQIYTESIKSNRQLAQQFQFLRYKYKPRPILCQTKFDAKYCSEFHAEFYAGAGIASSTNTSSILRQYSVTKGKMILIVRVEECTQIAPSLIYRNTVASPQSVIPSKARNLSSCLCQQKQRGERSFALASYAPLREQGDKLKR